MRVPGHGLNVTWDHTRSYAHRSSTGTCLCGWSHTARTRDDVRREYYRHRRAVHNTHALRALTP